MQVAWHDLAFFDPAMYESLRKLIVESEGEEGKDRLAAMGLSFQVHTTTTSVSIERERERE